jgi:hypothetical protein
MNAELVFFGKRVDMAQRSRRRSLVTAIYGAFAALLAVLCATGQLRGNSSWIIWFALLACRFFLGGYYTGGLVKPFNGKGPKQPDAPPSLLALKLRLYRAPAEDGTYRNDERELRQRDHAHYLAFQALGMALAVPLLVASLRLIAPQFMNRIPMGPDAVYYGLLLVAMFLFLTLPQAILLWTEPDMPEPDGTALDTEEA